MTMNNRNFSLFNCFKKRVTESLYFGSKSTAIKILHRILELDGKIETTRIYDESALIRKLCDSLEGVMDYSKYRLLQEEQKIAVREAIAHTFHEKSKGWITTCIDATEHNELEMKPYFEYKKRHQYGLAYNCLTTKFDGDIYSIDKYDSVQFPDNFFTKDLMPHIQQAINRMSFFSSNLRVWMMGSYDVNSFFAHVNMPKEVIHYIGKNLHDMEGVQILLQ